MITPEQLDEMERRAQEALEAETAYDVDPTQLTESRLILAHEKMLLAAGDGATPAMPGATILQLVAIARAALAWNEARKRIAPAREALDDLGTRSARTSLDDAFDDLDRYQTALDAALRGKP